MLYPEAVDREREREREREETRPTGTKTTVKPRPPSNQTSHLCTHRRKLPQAPHEYKKINMDPATTEPTAKNHHTHCKNQHKPRTHCTNQTKPINHCTHRTNQCKYQHKPTKINSQTPKSATTDQLQPPNPSVAVHNKFDCHQMESSKKRGGERQRESFEIFFLALVRKSISLLVAIAVHC